MFKIPKIRDLPNPVWGKSPPQKKVVISCFLYAPFADCWWTAATYLFKRPSHAGKLWGTPTWMVHIEMTSNASYLRYMSYFRYHSFTKKCSMYLNTSLHKMTGSSNCFLQLFDNPDMSRKKPTVSDPSFLQRFVDEIGIEVGKLSLYLISYQIISRRYNSLSDHIS